MEKILNDEEKIRRAEEIYYRRNNQTMAIKEKRDKNRNKKSIKYKILLNILIMFNIAVIIFGVQNKEFVFTNEFLETISKYNSNAISEIMRIFSTWINDKNEMDFQEKGTENENMNQMVEGIVDNKSLEKSEVPNVIEENNTIISSSINEMELDVQNLKAAYSFALPVKGIVSSTFGARESKYQNVTGYHTGIDIAADKGTKIKSAMQGIVELVSSEGDYGKHIKIRCNNVTTLYAHCSKIYVKEGQIVAEGQEIAEVGNTGNSTGPHLHFEIRVNDRFVDPNKIIEF